MTQISNGLRTQPSVRKVLIIDDHSFFSFCLRSLVEREPDLTVCDVASGDARLVERIRALSPDLLVMDLSVGRQGGFEVARALRAAGVLLPILFLSTVQALPRRKLARVAGAAFAPKAGNPAHIVAKMKRLLGAAGPWDLPSAVA